VLGEKPISDSHASAQRMVEAAFNAKCRHMITQNYRFGSVPRTTRRLVQADTVGQPGQLDVSFYMSWADAPGSHYVTQPYMFLMDMSIHHFDMMRYVLGADPVSVQCTSWNQPWGWHKGDACHIALFKFPNGLVATHRAIGCSTGKKTSWNGDWRIEGPKGSITWEKDKIFVVHDHRTDLKKNEEVPVDALKFTGEKATLNEFISAIKENRQPECSGEDNIKSLAMALGAVKSAKEGREVKLSEI
jgi:predicted dehydrogenase